MLLALIDCVDDLPPKLDPVCSTEFNTVSHLTEEVKVLLELGLSELGVHLVVNPVASHVFLNNRSHLVLSELQRLRDEAPSVPGLVVFLNLQGSKVAPLHPLLDFLGAHPMTEPALNGDGSFKLLNELRLDLQTHQQVLLGQVLDLPFRDGYAVTIGVKLCHVALGHRDFLLLSLTV